MIRRRVLPKQLVFALVGAGLLVVYVLQWQNPHPQQGAVQRLAHDVQSVRQGASRLQRAELWVASLQAPMLLMDSPLDNVTCHLLSSGAVTDKQKLQQLTDTLTNGTAALPNGGVQLQDCDEWRRGMGFHRWPVTPQEDSFPLAFSFKVHADPAMFERFLSVLWRPQNWFCIHVDSKSPDDVFLRFQNLSRCFDNVVMTSVRHNVVHASIVSLHADLECAKLALASSVQWKYHVSSCGMEFPLKTNLEMVQILTLLNGSNDIENYPPAPAFYNYALLNRWEMVDSNQPGARLNPTDVQRSPFQHPHVAIRKGSAYNCLTRPFLQWALTNKVNQDLLEWLKDAWAADEVFWSTLSYRPEAPGGPGVQLSHEDGNVITVATIWPWDKGHKCLGAVYRSSCIFGSLDLPWLLSRHELLANKFSPDQDSTVLRCLEAELERRALSGYIAWSAVWRLQQIHDERLQGQPQRPSDSGQGAFRAAWLALPHVNWTQYRSFPHFARRAQQQQQQPRKA